MESSIKNKKIEYSVDYLKKLKIKIESLDKCHHSKIFEICVKNHLQFSENRNGIFINMNLLTESIVNDFIKYINYVTQQEKNLKEIENIKMDFKKDFFKEDKDNYSYI
jgi:hypothetical protein